MKHFKKRVIPAIEREYVDHVTCDLCGEKFEEESYCVDDTTIEGRESVHRYKQIQIKRHEGSNYPEGGQGTDATFDICGNCFEQKLIPWFASQGASPQVVEWDW